MVWPRPNGRRVVLAELNWLGGDLAVRYRLPANLVRLAAAPPGDMRADRLGDYLQSMGDLGLLLAPPSAEQTQAALEHRWVRVTDELRALADTDVLVDAGLLAPGAPSAEVLARADLGVLVARPTADAMVHLVRRLPRIPPARQGLVVLLVGDGPVKDREVEDETGLSVVGRLPWDPDGAGLLMSGSWTERGLRRSQLLRWSVNVAEKLRALAGSASTGPVEVNAAQHLDGPPTVPSSAPNPVPAGWYADPNGEARQRFWDGQGWTSHVAGVAAAPSPTQPWCGREAGDGQNWRSSSAPVSGIRAATETEVSVEPGADRSGVEVR
jgi:hypothetical protein